MEVTDYYNKFKSLSKVVKEMNQSDHGSPFVDIICRETGKDAPTLTIEEKEKMIKQGSERMIAMQLVMNADRDKYGSLIED